MTVREATSLLNYGTAYEIRGAYSGKTYHKSYLNSSKNLDKYADNKTADSPFYADLRMRGSDNNHWCIPVIVIWMNDYALCKGGQDE